MKIELDGYGSVPREEIELGKTQSRRAVCQGCGKTGQETPVYVGRAKLRKLRLALCAPCVHESEDLRAIPSGVWA